MRQHFGPRVEASASCFGGVNGQRDATYSAVVAVASDGGLSIRLRGIVGPLARCVEGQLRSGGAPGSWARGATIHFQIRVRW